MVVGYHHFRKPPDKHIWIHVDEEWVQIFFDGLDWFSVMIGELFSCDFAWLFLIRVCFDECYWHTSNTFSILLCFPPELAGITASLELERLVSVPYETEEGFIWRGHIRCILMRILSLFAPIFAWKPFGFCWPTAVWIAILFGPGDFLC